jgi:hypothetical protein
MGLNYHLGSHSATLEFGGEFRNSHKGQNAFTPTYDYCPQADPGYPNAPICSDAADNASPVNSEMFASGFQDPHYYGGSYHMGETTDHYKVDQFLGANPTLLPLDVAATRSSSDPANYDLIERISAGYIMNTFHLSHLSLQTGLRLEATHEYGLGNLVNPVAGPFGDGMDAMGTGLEQHPLPIPRTISILCPAFRLAMQLRPRRPSARSMHAASPARTSTTWCHTFRPPGITPWWPASATLPKSPHMQTTMMSS